MPRAGEGGGGVPCPAGRRKADEGRWFDAQGFVAVHTSVHAGFSTVGSLRVASQWGRSISRCILSTMLLVNVIWDCGFSYRRSVIQLTNSPPRPVSSSHSTNTANTAVPLDTALPRGNAYVVTCD